MSNACCICPLRHCEQASDLGAYGSGAGGGLRSLYCCWQLRVSSMRREVSRGATTRKVQSDQMS